MKNPLEMRLFSRRILTDSVAREQITVLSNFADGLVRPDKCSDVEPIRTRFDPLDITKPIQWLVQPHGSFMYVKGAPAQVTGVMWNLTRSPTARLPSPTFTNYWTGEFDRKWIERNGIDSVECFLYDVFRLTGSDFALLTTESDLQTKNRPASSYSYSGLNLDNGLPGLYWLNIFSGALADWLGLAGISEQVATLKRLGKGGLSLKFTESPADCQNLDVLQRQQALIGWLGPQRFFDIRLPDRKLETPVWELLES